MKSSNENQNCFMKMDYQYDYELLSRTEVIKLQVHNLLHCFVFSRYKLVLLLLNKL